MFMSCLGSFYHHSSLINNIYPSSAGKEGAIPSNLSLLVYYASSKPHKMPKIGAYLEKRLARDMRRSRVGYIRITLQILNALLNECQSNVNLISKSVMRIILAVLNHPDPDLAMQAAATYHNHENIIDLEINDGYCRLITKFCNEATLETGDPLMKHKTRLSGLKALESVCSSDSFLNSPSFATFVPIFTPAIFANLSGCANHINTPNVGTGIETLRRLKQPSMPRNAAAKRESIADELITESEVQHAAERCVKQLFSRCSLNGIKELNANMLKDFDDKSYWLQKAFAVGAIYLVIQSTPNQYHYVIMASISDRLQKEPDLHVKETCTLILTHVVSCHKGFIGLTIPELLDTFSRQMKDAIQISHDTSKQTTEKEQARHLAHALIEGIGSLGFHVIYPDQMNDILSYLLNRLLDETTNTPSKHLEELTSTTSPFSFSVLLALTRVLDRYAQGQQIQFGPGSVNKRSSFLPSPLNSVLIVPVLGLLKSKDLQMREHAFLLLEKAVSLLFAQSGIVSAEDTASLFQHLRAIVSQVALLPHTHIKPIDYLMLGSLLKLLIESNTLHSADEIALTGATLLFLQSRLQEQPALEQLTAVPENGSGDNVPVLLVSPTGADNLSLSQKKGLASLIVEGFLTIADTLKHELVHNYISSIKKQRQASGEWVNGYALQKLESRHLAEYREKTFDAFVFEGKSLFQTSSNAVDTPEPAGISTWIDSEKVIDCFVDNPTIKKHWETALSTFKERDSMAVPDWPKGKLVRRVSTRSGLGLLAGGSRQPSPTRTGPTISFRSSARSTKPELKIKAQDLKDALFMPIKNPQQLEELGLGYHTWSHDRLEQEYTKQKDVLMTLLDSITIGQPIPAGPYRPSKPRVHPPRVSAMELIFDAK